jgi:aspartyl-tRNA(Asn)/glutamyl-tRNA(Gln) amidotransferase subunit C
MALTPFDVRRIAELARLDLGADEQARMLEQLNSFFRIVEQMSAVETSGIEPLYTPLAAVEEARLRLRADEVSEVVDRDANKQSAPATLDGLYLVPKVIE